MRRQRVRSVVQHRTNKRRSHEGLQPLDAQAAGSGNWRQVTAAGCAALQGGDRSAGNPAVLGVPRRPVALRPHLSMSLPLRRQLLFASLPFENARVRVPNGLQICQRTKCDLSGANPRLVCDSAHTSACCRRPQTALRSHPGGGLRKCRRPGLPIRSALWVRCSRKTSTFPSSRRSWPA